MDKTAREYGINKYTGKSKTEESGWLPTDEENPYRPRDLRRAFDKGKLSSAMKIANRGNEPCPHYKDWSRHSCSECWRELLQEIEKS